MTCVWCNGPTQNGAKYCSSRCKMAYYRRNEASRRKPLLTLTCRCGTVFTQKNTSQTFCCKSCQLSYYNAEKRNKTKSRQKKVKVPMSELLDRVVWQAWQNSDADWRRVIEMRNPTMRFVEATI